MSKKPVAVLAAFATLLVYTSPAFAFNAWWLPDHGSTVRVTTDTAALANTGGNSQSNVVAVEKAHHIVGLSLGAAGYKSITTGSATANASSYTVVKGPSLSPAHSWTNTEAKTIVSASTLASADSGNNYQDNLINVKKASYVIAGAGGLAGSSEINTGSALSNARNVTLVNVHTHGFGH